jgi:hypothetical protein
VGDTGIVSTLYYSHVFALTGDIRSDYCGGSLKLTRDKRECYQLRAIVSLKIFCLVVTENSTGNGKTSRNQIVDKIQLAV